MSGRGILNVVEVLNDAIKHMRKDFIPIYGDSHASTIRDLSTGTLILGLSPRIEKQLSYNEPMIESARRFPPPWFVEELHVKEDSAVESFAWADTYYFFIMDAVRRSSRAPA
jgi:hypothetical protein